MAAGNEPRHVVDRHHALDEAAERVDGGQASRFGNEDLFYSTAVSSLRFGFNSGPKPGHAKSGTKFELDQTGAREGSAANFRGSEQIGREATSTNKRVS